MPHSGGGGSSGGGYHGGSSHGSYSNHRSNKPYPGSRPYIYYRHHTPVIFYADKDPKEMKTPGVLVFIILAIFALVVPAFLIFGSYHNPTKNLKNHDETIVIDDNQDYLTDEEEVRLSSIFIEYNEKTGVMPVLVTVDYKYNLEDFVLDYYVSNWTDESHWVVAYCAKEAPKTDWEYEIAQGYDTDDIFYDSVKERYFFEPLSSSLNGDKTVGESFISAFSTLLPELMKEEFYMEGDSILFLSIWESCVALFVIIMVFSLKEEKLMKTTAEPVSETAKIEAAKCPNCGTTYYKGIVKHCHKCGHLFESDDIDKEDNAVY